MKRFTFSVPQNILFGEGVLKELPGAAGKLGGKHGFIISGPTLNRLGVVGQCEEILTQAGIAVSTFCDTEGNPSVETVERAAEAFRASGADFIVALGGGSPMDVAKAVGVVAKYGGSITEVTDPELSVYEKYQGWNERVWGNEIITILRGARKYSGYDIEPFIEKLKWKKEYMQIDFPDPFDPERWNRIDVDELFAED